MVRLMVEDDGNGESPVKFDYIGLEILFNDGPYVIASDPMARPVPGELAKPGSKDAFVDEPVHAGRLSDPGGPFSRGSLATLQPRSPYARGPYKTATGLAGIRDFESPFELNPQRGPVQVFAGLLFPTVGLVNGTSSIIVVGDIYFKNRPVPYISSVGKVTVRARSDGKMYSHWNRRE